MLQLNLQFGFMFHNMTANQSYGNLNANNVILSDYSLTLRREKQYFTVRSVEKHRFHGPLVI